MLQTERLNLRELVPSDLEEIHRLHSLPETDEFNTLGIPETIATTEAILAAWLQEKHRQPRKAYVFGIELMGEGHFIGLIALVFGKDKYRSAEVWFMIHKDHWRNGYTTEALIRILGFGFGELQLHRIEAGCAVQNIGSTKVMEKAGMIREGTKRKNLPIRGSWKDNYFYGILAEEFFGDKQRS